MAKAAPRRRWPSLPKQAELSAGPIDINLVKAPGGEEGIRLFRDIHSHDPDLPVLLPGVTRGSNGRSRTSRRRCG